MPPFSLPYFQYGTVFHILLYRLIYYIQAEILQLIKSNEIKLISCEGDENEKSTRRISDTFKMRHINHGLEVWQNCDDDRWPNWRIMFREMIV